MEGCTGSTVVQGYMNAPCRVLVQVGGQAFRLNVSSLLKRLSQLPFLRYALSRFSATMLREAIISVGCSQLHSVEHRLGRWLLAHQHRTGRSAFPFTHDFLAEQLGVQRATISEALASLQDRKIIRYAYRLRSNSVKYALCRNCLVNASREPKQRSMNSSGICRPILMLLRIVDKYTIEHRWAYR
jgi:DNA-binding transcriptional ArsR family regulator